jgi:hypothetical protein
MLETTCRFRDYDEFLEEWGNCPAILESFVLKPLEEWTEAEVATWIRFNVYRDLSDACVPLDVGAAFLKMSTLFDGEDPTRGAEVTTDYRGRPLRIVLVNDADSSVPSPWIAPWVYCFEVGKEGPGMKRFCSMRMLVLPRQFKACLPPLVLCSLLQMYKETNHG